MLRFAGFWALFSVLLYLAWQRYRTEPTGREPNDSLRSAHAATIDWDDSIFLCLREQSKTLMTTACMETGQWIQDKVGPGSDWIRSQHFGDFSSLRGLRNTTLHQIQQSCPAHCFIRVSMSLALPTHELVLEIFKKQQNNDVGNNNNDPVILFRLLQSYGAAYTLSEWLQPPTSDHNAALSNSIRLFGQGDVHDLSQLHDFFDLWQIADGFYRLFMHHVSGRNLNWEHMKVLSKVVAHCAPEPSLSSWGDHTAEALFLDCGQSTLEAMLVNGSAGVEFPCTSSELIAPLVELWKATYAHGLVTGVNDWFVVNPDTWYTGVGQLEVQRIIDEEAALSGCNK
eukprot:TRINITY_DN70114_c0_g1_i1.p1 TRINITY_DN70114_c0_g1~~TRINITY_DN70114_c0_g1_i1.p1  ORF type:complete len:340 (+),score=20.22 TRINITY_DN70114_c0_g1_i1:41-1060(+)